MPRIARMVPTFVALTLAAAAFLVAGAGTAWAHKETPILECVFHDTGTGQYNSVWGYNSSSGSVETIAVGSSNNFAPNPQDRGQPTSFQPGQSDNVLTVTWNGSGALTWNLNGHSVSATTGSTACAHNPVPIVAIQTVLWVAVGAGAVAVAVAFRRRNRQPASAPLA